MQQVFSNLPTRTETHVWEISGNPVPPWRFVSNYFFADFSLRFKILSYQVFTEVVTFHQVVTRL